MAVGRCQFPISRGDVVHAARRWIGTPYHHQASLRGFGADCLGLVRGVHRDIYGDEPERPPAYSADWAETGGHETMLSAAQRHLMAVEASAAAAGDVVIFRLRPGCVAKHAAILTARDSMVHAVEGSGVVEVPLGRWWRRRIAGAFSFPGIEN